MQKPFLRRTEKGLLHGRPRNISQQVYSQGRAGQALQKLIGHTKVTTTMKYMHVDEAIMVQAVEAIGIQSEV